MKLVLVDGNNLVRIERDLSKVSQEEIKKIIKQHAPGMTEEEKLLIMLLGKNAVSKNLQYGLKVNLLKNWLNHAD